MPVSNGSPAAADRRQQVEVELRQYLRNLERPWHWSEEAIEVMLMSEGRCEYCKADLTESEAAFWSSEIDHVLPRDAGGEASWKTNKALACYKCNRVKRNYLPDGVTVDAMKSSDRQARIAVMKPMVQKLREMQHLTEVFERCRKAMEVLRRPSSA
jgi:hypothetical protein